MDLNTLKEREIHFLDYWRVIRSRKEIILAVALLVIITGTAYTLTLPKIYRANARIEVRQDTLDVSVFEREAVSGYNPFFLRTQYEIIQSRPILYQVIENLKLQQVWGEQIREDKQPISRDEAYDTLRSSLRISQFRDTPLLDLQIFRREPEEAARIANAVAIAYRDQRLNAKKREMTRAIDALSGELKKQQDIVTEAEAALEDLRKELDISFAGPITVDEMRVRQLEGDRIQANVDMLVRKARLDQIMSLSNEELVDAVPYIVPDRTMQVIRNALLESDVALRLALEQYGPAHPEVRRLEAGVEALNGKLSDALDGLRKGVAADYAVSAKKHEQLQIALTEVRQADIEAQGERFLPFRTAFRNTEQQRRILSALQARVVEEGVKLGIPRTPVEIIEPAEPPPLHKPVSPNVLLNILLSIAVGVTSGIGLAFFIEYLDTSVKTVDDVERNLGLPVIGVIPQKVRPLTEEGPDSPHAESYRLLRTNLQFSNKGITGGAYGVVSGGVGEGKSTTLFNLAYVCAQLGDKVLIVDSDLRRPVQHTFLNISNRFGLTNLLMRDVPLEEVIKPTSVPNLHILPSGRLPRSALGLLDSQRMRELVKNLKVRYDYVFFDAPPLMGISDASILASEVDGVMLIVQYRKYPRVISERAKRMVENVGGNLLGVVLNNINIMRDDYYYYYHGYYTSDNVTAHAAPDSSPVNPAEAPEEEPQEVF